MVGRGVLSWWLMCIRYTGYAGYAFTLPHSCSLTLCIMRNAMTSNTLFFSWRLVKPPKKRVEWKYRSKKTVDEWQLFLKGNGEGSWCIPVSLNPNSVIPTKRSYLDRRLTHVTLRISGFQDLVDCKVYICDKTEQTFVDECWWRPSETGWPTRCLSNRLWFL